MPSFIILGKRYKFSINRKRLLFEQFLTSGFILLAEEESRELVLGGIGQFWKLGGSFSIIDNTQETRFYIPDQITLKKFARYWFLIHSLV